MSENYTHKAEDLAKNATERGKKFLKESNSRHVIIKQANGKKLVELNMTLAIILGVIVFLMAWWLLPVIAAVGYFTKLRVETTHELQKDDKIIEIHEA